MYQITFSDQSMRELNKLDKLLQLQVLEPLSSVRSQDLAKPREPLGRFQRNNKIYYRIRCSDYRIYFEVQGEALYVHYLLHYHTWQDFLFRMKLPVTDETLAEANPTFWKYLESLKK